MFKSPSRSIKCMPLHFCDLQNTSMYLHNEYALLSLYEEYVQNFISSPVIKQIIHLMFFFKIHCLFIKCIFYCQKLHDPPLAATAEHQKVHDDVILTSALRSYICLKLTVTYFPSDKYTFDCKYVLFCIELNIFIRLKIAYFFPFLICPVCYLYVMSQSIFHDQIRPRPLIACLNCAAYWNYMTKMITLFLICNLHTCKRY